MDATRRRFGSLVEWVVAAAFSAAAVSLLLVAVDEFRTVHPVVPVSAKEAAPDPALPGIPPGVVSVPILLLDNQRALRVGESLEEVARDLGAASRLLSESLERSGDRLRMRRFYNDAGQRFILVFDAAREGDVRLSAIYMN